MIELSGLTVLIVDPNAGMRSSMHNMLNQCGITKIEHAVSSGTAIRPLKEKSFDLIFCEYDLSEGQDGQQLLEDLRHNKIIPLWTVFFMVTAERSYEKVVSAAEFAPSDYILKPFTADALLARVRRAVEKRAVFLPIFRLMENGNSQEAIANCKAAQVQHPRYSIDFMRLCAELHLTLGEPAAAEPIYEEFAAKSVAWARLGLAKTMFMQQRFSEAEDLLTNLVSENNRFMDAYDWLAKTREAIGKLQEAQEVLQSAVAISPHAVRRLRRLGEVALEAGDVDVAEKSFQQVVSKAKYSEFRDPEDHVRLVQTLVKKGNTDQAATVIRDLERSLGNQKKTAACSAISSAMLHAQTGDTERAAEELTAAVEACRGNIGLSSSLKMELAKNCLENNLEEGASEIMLDVIGNAAGSVELAKAQSVFEQAGRQDLAESVTQESHRQVIELVAAGAEKAKQGDFRGAVELMTAAVNKLPNNPQVVFNAAVATLKYLGNKGWDSALGAQARDYIESARRLDPTNPRLGQLSELYQGMLKKHGKGG